MCAHNGSGHDIVCQVVHTHILYIDKHTSAREEIKNSPPNNLSEGGSLHLPIAWFSMKYDEIFRE